MISIIIPACNEERSIQKTIAYVYAQAAPYKRMLKEVIVVDGGSTDHTLAEVSKTGATIMVCTKKSRAALLNYGARQATGEILYFLQSNSLPPENFISLIVKAKSKGYAGGTFSLRFDYRHWLLNTLSWFTNNASWVYLSDQSLFVTKELFHKSGGFREDHFAMANQELINRLKRYTNFIVMKDSIVASAKKYLNYGILKTEAAHGLVFVLHKLGYGQQIMTTVYRKFMRWDIGPKTEKKKVVQSPREINQQAREVKKNLTVLSR